jgi:hypothetical protein
MLPTAKPAAMPQIPICDSTSADSRDGIDSATKSKAITWQDIQSLAAPQIPLTALHLSRQKHTANY